jgi:hypothetical protein
MKDLLKKALRPLWYLTLSVYILSIPIHAKPLYSYAREVLVENRLVSLICEHGSAIFNQVTERVRLALVETASPKEKPIK